MSDHAVLDAFQRAIENNLTPLPNDDIEANEIFHHIKSAVNEASKNVLGKKPTNPERDWITPETLAQIHQKHEIRRQFGSKSVEYKLAKSICKKLCRIDKQKHIDKKHLDINSLPNSVKYYIAMKKLKTQMKEISRTGLSNQNLVKSSLIGIKSFYDGMNFTLNYITVIAKSSPAMTSLHPYFLPLHLKSKMP